MTSLASTPVLFQRRVLNALFQALCGICAIIAIAVLGYVLWFLFRQGITYFKPSFFTRLPDNVNPALGGIKHSILGSVNILGIALSISRLVFSAASIKPKPMESYAKSSDS